MADDAPLWVWKDDDGAMELSQLWAEYQYRHEHVWKTVFQATLAVVTLSILPYIAPGEAGAAVFLTPVLAIAVGLLAIKRLDKELRALSTVKDAYLDKTRDPRPDKNKSRFKRDLMLYVWGLCVAAAANIVWIGYLVFGEVGRLL